MSATEHDKDRTPQHRIENLSGVKPSDGDDRQLPGIGYRRDRPTLAPAQEPPAQRDTTPRQGQAQFLLTGLSTLVPIAAFAVPMFRRQLPTARHDDASEARLTRLADQRGSIDSSRASRPSSVQSGRRYRLGLFPSLLLGALLGGGATLLYLSRKHAGLEADPQLSLGPRQPQPEAMSQQPSVPTIRGAVKEAAVTMVSQEQEMLSEARSTSNEQAPTALDAPSDVQHTALPDVAKAEAQPANAADEAPSTQRTPVTPAPSAFTQQSNTTPLTTATSSERQLEAAPASSPSISPSSDEEAAKPPQEPLAMAMATPGTAKREEKTTAAVPELQARIKEHMPVLDSKGMRVGAVDRVEGSGSIKLMKDGQGKHHWLPLRWVTRVDTHVHLARTAQQVRREWKTSAPRAH